MIPTSWASPPPAPLNKSDLNLSWTGRRLMSFVPASPYEQSASVLYEMGRVSDPDGLGAPISLPDTSMFLDNITNRFPVFTRSPRPHHNGWPNDRVSVGDQYIVEEVLNMVCSRSFASAEFDSQFNELFL